MGAVVSHSSKVFSPSPSFAGADEDHYTTRLNRMLGVVQRLLGLVEIQVLRRTALRYQNNIGPMRDLLTVQGV